MIRIFYLLTFSFVILSIIGCEETIPLSSNQRELKPPPGNGYVGEVCLLVRNKAPFSITGRIQLKLPAELSSNVVHGRYVYDMTIDSPTLDSTRRIIEGVLTIRPKV